VLPLFLLLFELLALLQLLVHSGVARGDEKCLQAIEAIKVILGLPGLLAGRLLCFCGYDMTFREFKVLRDPECAVCSVAGKP
jgi:molybdopterin/thiamine biosynthesis adenylyltransferase